LNSTGGGIVLTPHSDWVFIGGASGSRTIANAKSAILSLSSYSTAEANIIAAYAVQA
jgi:hypothetical protein